MLLEGVDGALSYVAPVHVWRHKLELAAPRIGNGKFICGAGIVVEHLEVNGVTPELETLHDVVVGCDAVALVVGLKSLDQDHIVVVCGTPA